MTVFMRMLSSRSCVHGLTGVGAGSPVGRLLLDGGGLGNQYVGVEAHMVAPPRGKDGAATQIVLGAAAQLFHRFPADMPGLAPQLM